MAPFIQQPQIGDCPLESRHETQDLLPCPLYCGSAVSLLQFVPWLVQHGINLPLFVRELFATRIGAFFGMDVIVSAVVLVVFARIEGARLAIRGRWVVLMSVLAVGVSLGLPLFLYLRERGLEAKA